MKSAFLRITLREIIQNKGRYLSILAIIALGTGFFGGLKITTTTMVTSVNQYYSDMNLFDLRLISTVGFTETEVAAIAEHDNVMLAEGAIMFDALYEDADHQQVVFKTHSIPDTINSFRLEAGRLPENSTECLLDSHYGGKELLGSQLSVTKENDTDVYEYFRNHEYTIVGIISTPYYMSTERGTTALGTGKLDGFVYLPVDTFDMDYYTDIFVCYDRTNTGYIEDYQGYIASQKALIEPLCRSLVLSRGEHLLDEMLEKEASMSDWLDEYNDMDKGKIVMDAVVDTYNGFLNSVGHALSNIGRQDSKAADQADADSSGQKTGKPDNSGNSSTNGQESENDDFWNAYRYYQRLKNPNYYILTRSDNLGNATFETDAEIIDSIADVFPVFFFLIATLVCMTTMNRMVEEQRTQIGILKALGYSNRAILSGYLVYAASAACIGSVFGYMFGTYIIPRVLWIAYGLMYKLYGFTYQWAPFLAVGTILTAIAGSTLVTYLTGRYILTENASELMRPKAPKAGKRILLERIPFIWSRLKFLQKVSTRNIFRYKKRLFMMILGISGCTALLLAGFGLKDSIAGFADEQYRSVEVYDAAITLQNTSTTISQDLETALKTITSSYQSLNESSWNIKDSDMDVTLRIFSDPEAVDQYMQFTSIAEDELTYPSRKTAYISSRIASDLGLTKGDELILENSDHQTIQVSISGIFQNHMYNYIIISEDTYRQETGTQPEQNLILANFSTDDETLLYQKSALLMQQGDVLNVSLTMDVITRVNAIMHNFNYVNILVILCSALLAFIVLYNLTNINITERTREIATIKVLGFFRNETSAYIFRENIVLTIVGSALGLIFGFFLHRYIMNQIHIDWINFSIHINVSSYLLSYGLTILFGILVDLFMIRKIDSIDMVESLKSVD